MKLGNETDTNNSENNNGLIFGLGDWRTAAFRNLKLVRYTHHETNKTRSKK